MVTADFNNETGILDSKFEGDVTLKEIVDYIRATKENAIYPRLLKILTDSTRANMNFNHDDLEVIVNENLESIKRYEFIIDAIVLDSPKETALSILYQKISAASNYRFQVFSTREAAIEWLKNTTPGPNQ